MLLSEWGSAYGSFDLVIPKLATADRGNYSAYNPELDELLTLVQRTETRSSARRLFQCSEDYL